MICIKDEQSSFAKASPHLGAHLLHQHEDEKGFLLGLGQHKGQVSARSNSHAFYLVLCWRECEMGEILQKSRAERHFGDLLVVSGLK